MSHPRPTNRASFSQGAARGESPLWIFAYGSLLFRPGFSYVQRVRGVVRGRERRFWQSSIVHRGTPERPGRVVTLVPEPRGECWGVAYAVSPSDRQRVLAELDVREQGGYVLRRVAFEAKDRTVEGALTPHVYVAEPGNPNWAGPAPLPVIAEQVREAVGPSGHNAAYVLRLAESLCELGVTDEHVFELANLLGDSEGE